MFRQREQRSVPAIGMPPRGVVERDAQIVADVRAGYALQKIFVEPVVPLAGNIFLREDRGADPQGEQRPQDDRLFEGSHIPAPRDRISYMLKSDFEKWVRV